MSSSSSSTVGRSIHFIYIIPAAGGGRIASAAWGRHEAVRSVLIRVDILFFDVRPG
jgi:hypothetical protein